MNLCLIQECSLRDRLIQEFGSDGWSLGMLPSMARLPKKKNSDNGSSRIWTGDICLASLMHLAIYVIEI